MTQIRQTSQGTGLGMNAIPVFSVSQPVDVSADDYVWLVNGEVPTVTVHNPLPYENTETETYEKLIPFKLKVSESCYLNVQLEGESEGSTRYFNEGENNQMVVKVFNHVDNTLTGAVNTGDIVAYR